MGVEIKILGASAPSYGNEDKTVINLRVRLSHLPNQTIDFTASPDDQSEHGRELYSRAKFGEFGTITLYTGPTKEQMEMAMFPKLKRLELEKVEALIAPLQRAVKYGIATPEEIAELEALERHTVAVMRAEGPVMPTRV